MLYLYRSMGKKVLYGKIRKFLGPVFHELARQRGSKIVEGHMVADHVHMLIQIPPKYAVSEVIGYIKGKECDSCSDGSLEEGNEISMERSFGPEGMRYRR